MTSQDWEERETNGPPILKIELLPANESEILNAGISFDAATSN